MCAAYPLPYDKDTGVLRALRGIPVCVTHTPGLPAYTSCFCMPLCGARHQGLRKAETPITLGGGVVGHKHAKQPLASKMIAPGKQNVKCSGNTKGTSQSQLSCVNFCLFFKESICLSPGHPTCTSELEFSMCLSLRLALIKPYF